MTREQAIAFFEDMNECTYGNLEAVEMAIKALEQEPRWIPCSERLPEYETEVLVTDKYSATVSIAVLKESPYIKGRDEWDFGYDDMYESLNTVTAWQPLPEPYKAESETQESEGKE